MITSPMETLTPFILKFASIMSLEIREAFLISPKRLL
jgi:hypothetical protein